MTFDIFLPLLWTAVSVIYIVKREKVPTESDKWQGGILGRDTNQNHPPLDHRSIGVRSR
jgi:hypothetical protein